MIDKFNPCCARVSRVVTQLSHGHVRYRFLNRLYVRLSLPSYVQCWRYPQPARKCTVEKSRTSSMSAPPSPGVTIHGSNPRVLRLPLETPTQSNPFPRRQILIQVELIDELSAECQRKFSCRRPAIIRQLRVLAEQHSQIAQLVFDISNLTPVCPLVSL
jgi:hypothetical protein